MDRSLVHSLGGWAVLGFLLCSLPLPVLRVFFHRWRILDQPGYRKIHTTPTPRVGGIAIVLACGIVWMLQAETISVAGKLLVPTAVIFLVGLIDDLRGITPVQKLLGQTAAGCLAVVIGIRVTTLGGLTIPEGVSFLLTIGWLVACSNAFNLIDGLDGLGGGLGFLGFVGLTAAAYSAGDATIARLSAPLAGIMLGFLPWNLFRAKVFLGDSGAYTVGFLVGCLGILWCSSQSNPFAIAQALAAAGIPLIDLVLSLVRRSMAGKPILSADRQHIHHRLLDRGLSPGRTAMVLYLAASAGIVLSFLPQISALIILVALLLWGIRQLRYPEFQFRLDPRLRQPLR